MSILITKQGVLVKSTSFLNFVVFIFITNTCFAEDFFDIRAQSTTSYDDNVTFAHINEKNDIVQSVLLGLDLKAEKTRNNFLAQIDIFHNFYFDNRSFDNTTVAIKASNRFDVSPRLRLHAAEKYERSEEPRSFEDEFGRSAGRYRIDRNTFDLGADYELNSQTLLQWSYANEFTGYSRQDLDDADMNRTGGRIEYAFSEVNRLGAGYDFAYREFDGGNKLQNHTLFVDFGHKLTNQLELTVRIGQDFIDNDQTGSTEQARYEVSLNNEIDAATYGGLKYSRGINSYAYSQDLFDSYRISLTFARELTSRISVSCAGFLGEGQFKQSGIEDQLSGAGLGMQYALTPQAVTGLNYSFSETDSNQSSRSYQRNLISFLVRTKF